MDFLIGGFAKARLEEMSEQALKDFSALLELPDPMLENLIWGKAALEEGHSLAEMLGLVQVFHGIKCDD